MAQSKQVRSSSPYVSETFLGMPKSSQEFEWLSKYGSVIKPLMQHIVDTCVEEPIKKIEDLPQHRVPSVGSFHPARIIKPFQDSYNPDELYVLLDNETYSRNNREWTKFLPPLPKSVVEAHQVITALLNVYCSLYSNQTKTDIQSDNFVNGQLVLVKVRKQDNYQMRRGCIQSSTTEKGRLNYSVWLLDFGATVSCSKEILMTLPKPFDTLAPLAVKCTLHGISPVDLEWSDDARTMFSEFLQSHQNSMFVVNVLSDFDINEKLIISVDVVNSSTTTYQTNLTQFLIDHNQGIQWNLFPARPGLMANSTIAEENNPVAADHEELNIPKPSRSYRDALMVTNAHLPDSSHARLPLSVVKRELGNLWTSKGHAMSSLYKTQVVLTAAVNHPPGDFTPALPPPVAQEGERNAGINVNIPDLRKTAEERVGDAKKLAEEDEKRKRMYSKVRKELHMTVLPKQPNQ